MLWTPSRLKQEPQLDQTRKSCHPVFQAVVEEVKIHQSGSQTGPEFEGIKTVGLRFDLGVAV